MLKEGFGVVCKKREGERRNGMKGQTKGGGRDGEGWEREWQWEEGSVCGAVLCCAARGGSEVWLFGGMGGEGRGAGQGERVGVGAVVAVVAVMVGRGGWWSPWSSLEAKEKEMAGLARA